MGDLIKSIDALSLDVDDLGFKSSEGMQWDSIELSSVIEKKYLGRSEQGRDLWAFKLGHGDKKVSLLAGCHSDEPVGPEMLRRLVCGIKGYEELLKPLLDSFTFFIFPHINPDGEVKNESWIKTWPDLKTYLRQAFRELPGRDVEFGFPEMRRENQLWSDWLKREGPFDLHISFHGMGYSEGTMLLIERHWMDRTTEIQSYFIEMSESHGYALHDHDRKGDKGFNYIGPGFTTTPEGKAMKKHFLNNGDQEMASKFHLSSMEWIRSLGGDPLCLVTELPLFCIQKREGRQPGLPVHHLSLKQAKKSKQCDYDQLTRDLEIEPFPLHLALDFQLKILKQALKTVLK